MVPKMINDKVVSIINDEMSKLRVVNPRLWKKYWCFFRLQ
jgi:hypothetical protein